MGSAAGALEEAVEALNADGRAGRHSSRCACTGRSRPRIWSRRFPGRRGRSQCSTGRRTRRRWASRMYQDVVTALAEQLERASTGDRRPLRPRLEGVHAGDGRSAVYAELASQSSQAAFHRRHPRRRLRLQPRLRPGLPDGGGRTSFRPSSSASAPTAPSARTRTPSRSSPSGPGCYAQGYFVYDSKKAGSTTVSHMRFGPQPIDSTYLIDRAGFVACHHFDLLTAWTSSASRRTGATFLLNSRYGPDEVWEHLPGARPGADRRKRLRALRRRRRPRRPRGRARRPREHRAAAVLLRPRRRAPARRGDRARSRRRSAPPTASAASSIVERNFAAVDLALSALREVAVPAAAEPAEQAAVHNGTPARSSAS